MSTDAIRKTGIADKKNRAKGLLPLGMSLLLAGCLSTGRQGSSGSAEAAEKAESKGSSGILPASWLARKDAPPDRLPDTLPPAEQPRDKNRPGDKTWYNPSTWFQKPKAEGPADSLTIRGDQVEEASQAKPGTAAGDLAAALELYRQEKYSQAAKAFKKIADNTNKDYQTSPRIAEEARFYQAECYRREEYYRSAVDNYYRMMTDFPNGAHREEACQRMFDIANYWLQDTREEMELYKEKDEGKRWFVVRPVVHFERSKPFIDQEGHALQALERVYLNDMRGPLADRALFLIATVKFYREDYVGADQYFSQLVELYPNSKLASRSVELGIISKQMSTGGADYDGRKVAQARRLINSAFASYPDLAQDKREFLMKQLASCNLQQAEKDFKIAEFYRRTKKPGSAYFYYEIVRRRYPGTEFFDKATERMHELRAAAEAEQKKDEPKPEATDGGTLPPPRRLPADNGTLPPPRPVPPPNNGTLPPPRPVPPTANLTPGAPLDPNFAPPAGQPANFPVQPQAAQPVPR